MFICNRSGEFKSRGKGERKLRSQGSRKCGQFCPARIRLSVDEKSFHQIDFCSSHIGHENAPEHLNLPQADREKLKKKLQEGVSRRRILGDIRNRMDSENLRPIDLVGDKHLSNICQRFSIDNVNRSHTNDLVSVASWVATKKSELPSIILHFKNQHEEDQEHQLRFEDFFLAIMTPIQEKMLQKFGKKCITVDSTHGVNNYDILLTTIMVLDEEG